jgi:hypothetical protein
MRSGQLNLDGDTDLKVRRNIKSRLIESRKIVENVGSDEVITIVIIHTLRSTLTFCSELRR